MNLLSKLFEKKYQIEFIENKNGLHIFGGEIPENFNIPENKFLANYQIWCFQKNHSNLS